MAPPTARKRTRIKIVLTVIFSGLVAISLGVIFLLPSHVPQKPQISATVSVRPPPSPAPPSVTKPVVKTQEIDKPKADKLLSEALRRLARLESEGARIWGNEPLKTSLPVAEKALNQANALYDRQQYTPSLNHFQAAIDAFDQLEASRPERFQRAMDRGKKAYNALDAQTAAAQFQIALALAPGNGQAIMALSRARKFPKVLSNIARGKGHEDAGNLDQALGNYRTAASLDPASVPAKNHLARIKKMIVDRDYKRAVSQALVLLDKQDFNGATRALRRAGNIRPNTPEVKDIARRVATAAQVAALENLRKTARAFEKQEKWSDALGQYKKALLIDKNAAFADRGRIRAKSFIELYAAMDSYLSDPTRLQSPDPLAHAKTLLAQSGLVDGPGKILKAKRKQLENLISLTKTKIPVLLRSDQKTEVTLYRIGRLGMFDARRMELLPGSYTAVGSRIGYREVRVKFQVSHTTKDIVVTIQCTEQIR